MLESRLYGRKLRKKETGKVYNIDRILVEQWTLEGGTGWWIKLLVEHDQSHALLYWQNINCTEPFVRKTCVRTQELWELI